MMDNVVIVPEDVPWETINEMTDLAVDNPRQVSVDCQIGSSNHLAFVILDESVAVGGGVLKFIFTRDGVQRH